MILILYAISFSSFYFYSGALEGLAEMGHNSAAACSQTLPSQVHPTMLALVIIDFPELCSSCGFPGSLAAAVVP